jgi:hypothetical protein
VNVKGPERTTTADLLEAIVAAEAAAKAFYHLMALAFAHHSGARRLWESMMEDEVQHVAAVSRVRETLTREQREQSVPASDLATVLQQQETLSESRIRAVRNLNEAYEIAHELENHEMDRLTPFLSLFVPAGERGDVMRAVLAHQAKLVEFRKASADRQWMRAVLARRS